MQIFIEGAVILVLTRGVTDYIHRAMYFVSLFSCFSLSYTISRMSLMISDRRGSNVNISHRIINVFCNWCSKKNHSNFPTLGTTNGKTGISYV